MDAEDLHGYADTQALSVPAASTALWQPPRAPLTLPTVSVPPGLPVCAPGMP